MTSAKFGTTAEKQRKQCMRDAATTPHHIPQTVRVVEQLRKGGAAVNGIPTGWGIGERQTKHRKAGDAPPQERRQRRTLNDSK